MTLLSSILGFSAFGFGARCFQLGLQHRPIFDAPHGHAFATIAFGMVGFGAYHVDQKQLAMLAEKKKVLTARREQEKIEWEAAKAGAGAGHGHAHAV